ncbi:cupin domain-containing protein [Leifsonia poae]
MDAFETTALIGAAALPLAHEIVQDDQRVSGEPATGLVELGTFGGLEIGVWEMTTGAMTDVEADELFVVVAGRATIAFEASGVVLAIGPGDIVRLTEGDRTTWTVTETLRKVYLT